MKPYSWRGNAALNMQMNKNLSLAAANSNSISKLEQRINWFCTVKKRDGGRNRREWIRNTSVEVTTVCLHESAENIHFLLWVSVGRVWPGSSAVTMETFFSSLCQVSWQNETDATCDIWKGRLEQHTLEAWIGFLIGKQAEPALCCYFTLLRCSKPLSGTQHPHTGPIYTGSRSTVALGLRSTGSRM